MKHFNADYEVIITSRFSPVDPKGKSDGEIIPHKEWVDGIEFFSPQQNEVGMIVYHKIILSRRMITDLHAHIMTIESNVEFMPLDELPF